MSTCTRFCDDLAELVFSGQPNEVIMEKATLMLRFIIEVPEEDDKMPVDGFKLELFDRNRHLVQKEFEIEPSNIDNPKSYKTGEAVGIALGKAMKRQLDKATLKQQLRSILCEG